MLKDKLSLLASAIAAKQAAYSLSELEMLEKLTGIGISEKGSGQMQVLPPLPEKISEETLPLWLIRQKIKELTGYKGRKSALYSTAALFAHLYNGGEGGYPALQKAASISEGGLAKLLMSLRKKGLIVNKGYRQPALTERLCTL